MECDENKNAGDDVIESEDGVLTIKNGCDSCGIEQTSNGFVVISTGKLV